MDFNRQKQLLKQYAMKTLTPYQLSNIILKLF